MKYIKYAVMYSIIVLLSPVILAGALTFAVIDAFKFGWTACSEILDRLGDNL